MCVHGAVCVCVFFLRGAEVQPFISGADCSQGNTQISQRRFSTYCLLQDCFFFNSLDFYFAPNLDCTAALFRSQLYLSLELPLSILPEILLGLSNFVLFILLVSGLSISAVWIPGILCFHTLLT
ncbi:hypothetical protein ILYODFUR_014703 [Ilyodon furcidens]|uniref:Secreted protein n=1 Tax=Ilyodon furcidens TaxID=33524 RepID=A0ABV0VF97_9TELE